MIGDDAIQAVEIIEPKEEEEEVEEDIKMEVDDPASVSALASAVVSEAEEPKV